MAALAYAALEPEGWLEDWAVSGLGYAKHRRRRSLLEYAPEADHKPYVTRRCYSSPPPVAHEPYPLNPSGPSRTSNNILAFGEFLSLFSVYQSLIKTGRYFRIQVNLGRTQNRNTSCESRKGSYLNIHVSRLCSGCTLA